MLHLGTNNKAGVVAGGAHGVLKQTGSEMKSNQRYGMKKGRRPAPERSDVGSPKVEGVLAVARSGTGFVTPVGGGENIVVASESVGQALPGDRVSVRMLPMRRGDTRPTGRIESIVARGAADIVCTLRESGDGYAAVPMIPNFQQSFHVDDPGSARPGDRVIVRFASWEDPSMNPVATITAVIGPADDPSLDTLSIIKMYDLPGAFPEAVLREAQSVGAKLNESDGREDLRDCLIVTIDPVTARDFDDALSLTEDDQGLRVLGVHIADVSHFVQPGSALDHEARKRGTSVYLVDTVIPMLPEQLSNGVCSLMPNEDRFAFSAFLTFNAAGTVVSRRFVRSVIRSSLRLTYEEAQQVIDAGENGSPVGTAPGRRLILALHQLTRQLRTNRFNRHALDINSPELVVDVDAAGMMTGVHPAAHTVSHELVEEAMVAANEAVAAEISNRHIPYISRFHDAPDAEKIAELSAAVAALGLEPGDLTHPGHVSRLLKAVRGTPLEYYVSMQVLKSMKRAEYTVDNEGHFGLAKRFYSHFTSPIRRYPDLVLHRQLAILLEGGGAGQPARESLAAVAASSTELEFRAEQASRDLIEMKKYRFLEKQLADGRPLEYEAVVVKVMEFGVFVEVPMIQVGGMIHISALSEKFVRYDNSRSRLTAPGLSIVAGDTLRVLVSGVNFDQRKVDFSVVGITSGRPRPVKQELTGQSVRRRERRERREAEGKVAPRKAPKASVKEGGGADRTVSKASGTGGAGAARGGARRPTKARR